MLSLSMGINLPNCRQTVCHEGPQGLLELGIIGSEEHFKLGMHINLLYCCRGHLIPSSSIQDSTARLWSSSPPLLKKERHPSGQTLLFYLPYPLWFDCSVARSAFPADNHPVDAVERQIRDWS